MKILAEMAMAAITSGAWAGPAVSVCMDVGARPIEIIAAEKLASRMFADIGVETDWMERANHADSCSRNDAIVITLSYQSAESDHPGVWGYARPYEGKHIVVFWDRMQRKLPLAQVRFLLAHVLVHEITHVLQGIARHSQTGVMKAYWDEHDIFEMMARRGLGFTELDVTLIYRGLAARSLAAASLGSSWRPNHPVTP